MRGKRVFSFALVSGLAACESPADPCAGCPVERPDMLVSSVEVRAHARDNVTDLGVVPRDSIDVATVITNAGVSDARAAVLTLDFGGVNAAVITLPAIRAGRSHRTDTRIATGVGSYLMDHDTMRVTASVVWSDSDPANNTRLSDAFHVPVPALRLHTEFDGIDFNVNVPYDVRIRVENVSRHAALPASRLAFCVHNMGAACRGADGASAFNPVAVPAIAPAETQEWAAVLRVPTGVTHQNVIDAVSFTSCIGKAHIQPNDLLDATDRGCSAPTQVFVRPDYEACAPPQLHPDVPTTGVATCYRPCPIYAYAIHVQPGYSYVIESPAGGDASTLQWRTRYRDIPADVSAERGLQPAHAETVYAVTAPKFCGGGGDQTVVLRQTPFGPGR